MVLKVICALSLLVLAVESGKHHKPAFSSQYIFRHDGHHQKTYIYVHEKPKKHEHKKHDEVNESNDGSYEEPTFRGTFEASPEDGSTFNAPANEGPTNVGPAFGGQTFGGQTFNAPTFEGQTFQPSFGPPTLGSPSVGPPTFSTPTFTAQNFEAPSFEESSDEESGSDEEVSSDHHKKHKKHKPKKHEKHIDYYTHPKYKFGYKVDDEHTGDKKSHHEHRDGHSVKGSYELHHPHASHRHVHYHADKHSGFHADVKHSTHHVVPKHHH